jgi:preprotein translocase subunit SecY
LFDTFAGGAFSQASILALGIMPYISASIFMQLMTILVPQMQKVQKEGESGRKKINQWTRYLTVIVTAFPGRCLYWLLNSPGTMSQMDAFLYFAYQLLSLLTAGTLFVMWLGEKIQDKGLGNGTSIIIMVGILARFPQSIIQEFSLKQAKGGGGLITSYRLRSPFFMIAIIMGLIILVQGVRKILSTMQSKLLVTGRLVVQDSSFQ